MRETLFVRFNTLQFALTTGHFVKYWPPIIKTHYKKVYHCFNWWKTKRLFHITFVTQHQVYVSDMRKLSTVQNGGFPNIFSFHIIHYTLFSSLKYICNKKNFHVARQTCWWKRPFHMGCQDKSGPGKIHEVILVFVNPEQKTLVTNQ